MKNSGLSWLAILVPLVMMFFGVKGTLEQHRKINTFEPIKVVIKSSVVKEHKSRDNKGHTSTSYEPAVTYWYKLNGQTYNSSGVYPFNETGGSTWAKDTVKKYERGMNVDGYYNPANPEETFLIPKYSFNPYMMTLLPMIFVVLGLFGLSKSSKYPKPPQQVENGMFRLKPCVSFKKRLQMSSLAFLLWSAVGAASLPHYFGNASPPYATQANMVAILYGAAALALMGYAIYLKILGRNIADAILLSETGNFRRGNSIKVEVRQAFKKRLIVEKAMVGIVVREIIKKGSGKKSRYQTSTKLEDWFPGVENLTVPAKEVLSLSAEITLPHHLPRASLPNSRYPRYIWSLDYKLKLDNSPDFKARFPIMVS